MERLRSLALVLIVILNVMATLVAFGESFDGNYQWAVTHGVPGFWGGVWPLMIDLIILVGEATLFVAHHDGWRTRNKAWAWAVTLIALGVSVAANTGHVQSIDWLSHLTAALPPIALMFTVTVGFGVMKRTFLNKPRPVVTPAIEFPIAGIATRPDDGARAHVGETPWVANPEFLTQMTPVAPLAATETKVVKLTQPEIEIPAPVLPPDDFELSETLLNAGFKVTAKSFKAERDPRPGLDLKRKRVRDMYDLDPDIAVNAIAQGLGIAWATAAKYLAETKEARGLELTDKERSYITSAASTA